jgi:hypothetical protein
MAKEQKDLPGMENRSIKELVDKATEYAEIRDKRQDLTRREVELKADLLTAMHKHKLKDYSYEGIEIHVVTEEETVRVKLPKKAEDEEDS